jgi:putative heme degradation protein
MIDKPELRRFPPPWSVDEADSKLDRQSFIVRDASGQALAYVYFEDESGRRAAAKLITRDEARRIAATSPSCRRCCARLDLLRPRPLRR